MARLGDICTVNMGQSPDSATYNEVGRGLPFFQGNADFGRLHPAVRVWCSEPTKIAHTGDILISVRAPIGAMNVADQDCCIGRGLAAIQVNENICDPQYLWYAIQSKVSDLNAKGTGSTFKAISKSTLTDTEVLLVPLDAQKNIARVLSNVENSILFRKEQLTKLDELIKARFVEMFGDPVTNPFNWPAVELGQRCEIITGNTPSRAEPENYGTFIEWIKSDNINTPSTFLTPAQEYLSEVGFQKCRFVESGSLLMTCIAGSLNCIGNVAVTNRRVAFNQQINAITPTCDNVLYLYWLMILSKPAIHKTINMALKGILSKSQLSSIKFPFPSIECQNQFADFVAEVDKSKVEVQKALDQTQLLFDSLMQQYFG